uniref:hypothetical protein n=1 Tax=Faecalibacterium prausnitzii TaxID=853 RepID=UPI003FED4840
MSFGMGKISFLQYLIQYNTLGGKIVAPQGQICPPEAEKLFENAILENVRFQENSRDFERYKNFH